VRVLEAARKLYTERGNEVQMEDIARAAGVGVGTLYRHFPTKRDLVGAAVQQRFEELLAHYREHCRELPSALDALTGLLVHIGEVQENDRAFCSVIETTMGSGEPAGDVLVEFQTELVDLLDKGQAAGEIRPDIAGSDLLAISCSLASVVLQESGDWRRFLDIVVEGLRVH
jgi:AcrR family transcriptional regulator